ncbi:unnamed protein product [Adineta ricciae]|uniref:Uncharacterized protein n=2 Tax=Adineta ricciae TaxID=249248 RepID=A0A816ECU8_ADIRI|nr:unnamed protein product [Adineta ricciae]
MRSCLFTALFLILIIKYVHLEEAKPRKVCLMCCGKPPCCNCCGLPGCTSGTDQASSTPAPSTASAAYERNIRVAINTPRPSGACLTCCGPPPCCNTCGLDI